MSYRVILKSERDLLVSRYELFLTTSQSSSHIFNELFAIDHEQSLGGYSMAVGELLQLLSHPGVTNWHVEFGYVESVNLPQEGNTETEVEAGFKMIVHGFNSSGQLITPYYLLENEVVAPALILSDVEGDDDSGPGTGNQIPTLLLEDWTNAWQNLVDERMCPLPILQIAIMENGVNTMQVLRGYTFDLNDLLSLFDVPNISTHYLVHFTIINHAELAGSPAEQLSKAGTIGIALGLLTPDGMSTNNVYYDFSAPCPPTCPDPPAM